MLKDHIKYSYLAAYETVKNFVEKDENIEKTLKVAEELAEAYKRGNKSLIAGNGGSNCDAMHFAEEFTGRFRKDRKALPSLSISDSSHITCLGMLMALISYLLREWKLLERKEISFLEYQLQEIPRI